VNALLVAPHRRDAFMVGREDEAPHRPLLVRVNPPDAQSRLTFDPDEAEYLATGSVRWDGLTTIGVETAVDSKDALWQLLAAIEQARRECAEEMGSAYMDRFEYGKEKRRG
jgi:hypothetical protein